MAPKRKQTEDNNNTTSRVTRSSARLASVTPPTVVKRKKTEPPAAKPKTITIEHCKQCNAFKTRAIQVKNGLEKAVAGVNVLVNPEKPRRGCFEIREEEEEEEGGEIFVSLLDMKRPFAPMKALDMDKLISDIVDKLK